MTPQDGGRFCAECKKVVRDLSRLTERKARALLAEPHTEGLCVRLIHDRDGRVMFADTPRPLLPASMLQRAKRAALVAGVGLATEACSGDPMGAFGDGSYDTLMGAAEAPTAIMRPEADAGHSDGGDAGDALRPSGDGGDASADAGMDADAALDGGATDGTTPEAGSAI